MADGRRFQSPQNFPQNRGNFHSAPPIRPPHYQATNDARNFRGNRFPGPQKGENFQTTFSPQRFQGPRPRPQNMSDFDNGDTSRRRNFGNQQRGSNMEQFRGQNSQGFLGYRFDNPSNQRPTNLNLSGGFPYDDNMTLHSHKEAEHMGRTNTSQTSQHFQGGQPQSNVLSPQRNSTGVLQMQNEIDNADRPYLAGMPPPFQGGHPQLGTPPPPMQPGSFPRPPDFSPNVPPPPLPFSLAPQPAPPFVPGQHPSGLSPIVFGIPPPMMLSGGSGSPIALGGQVVGTIPNVLSAQSEHQRQEDEDWVKKFVEKRGKAAKESSKEKDLKVAEAKLVLQRWTRLMDELKRQRDKLVDCVKSSPAEWKRELDKANKLKQLLQQTEEKLSSTEVNELQERLHKKNRKREWQKRRKSRRLLEKQEAEKRKQERHKQIDEWREQEIAKNQAKIKAANMKKEAGGVLGDVRKKQADASKALELIQALRKLRDFRKQEAELKGVYPKPLPEHNREFTDRMNRLEELMTKQSQLYDTEERTLTVMMAEEEEEKKRKTKAKKDTQNLAKAAASSTSDPLQAFYTYYTQAENSLQSLIYIRHGWDIYTVPDNILGTSRIPEGLPETAEPSSKGWAMWLKKKTVKFAQEVDN